MNENAYPESAWLAPTRYLRFELLRHPKRKTMTWAVVSQSSGVKLGEIRWHSAWRSYCFFPSSETIFNVECMNDIVDRIETILRWRRNIRANMAARTNA